MDYNYSGTLSWAPCCLSVSPCLTLTRFHTLKLVDAQYNHRQLLSATEQPYLQAVIMYLVWEWGSFLRGGRVLIPKLKKKTFPDLLSGGHWFVGGFLRQLYIFMTSHATLPLYYNLQHARRFKFIIFNRLRQSSKCAVFLSQISSDVRLPLLDSKVKRQN